METDTTQSPYVLLKTLPLNNVSVMGYELDIAYSIADHIHTTFGPGKRNAIPGHPEIELALAELFRESSQPRYLALAAFFMHPRVVVQA